MRKFIELAVTIFVFFGQLSTAQAETDTQDTATAAAEYFKQFVVELKEPVYVYNWSDASNKDAKWRSAFRSDGPLGLERVDEKAAEYWGKAGQWSPDMYRTGLYAAVDASSTRIYGGRGKNWVLLQIHLPQGFRFINLLRDGGVDVPIQVRKMFTQFGCPASWETGYHFFDSLFKDKSSVSGSCIASIKNIFDDVLKIDGFFYVYESSHFAECPQPKLQTLAPPVDIAIEPNLFPERNAAVVITSARSLTAENVRIFNRLTEDDQEDRLRIVSQFYKASRDWILAIHGSKNSSWNSEINQKKLRAEFDAKYFGYTYGSTNINDECISKQTQLGKGIAPCYSATLCPQSIPWCRDGKELSFLKYPLPPYPTKISASRWADEQDNLAHDFLWRDLEGKQTDPDLGSWAKTNLFGCADHHQYGIPLSQ